jgi:hypothetical protein
VTGLVLAAFGARLHALRASPFPTGIDGYWYLLQIRSLLEHGHLSSSSPLVPWLMAALSLVVEPVLALKIVAALGSTALVVPTFIVGKRICRQTGPALLGAALVVTSAQSFFLCTEFVKQAVGLSLAMGFVAALAYLLDRPSLGRGILALALLVAGALAHNTAVGLALLWAAPLVGGMLWRSRRLLAGSALGLLALLWIVSRNLAVLGKLFGRHANFSFAVLTSEGRAPLLLGHEVALATGLAVLVLGFAWLRKPTEGPRLPPLVIGFCAFAVLQALPWIDITDDQGLGYRLRLCAFTCLGPCAALLAARLLGRFRPTVRSGAWTLAVGLVLLRPWSSNEGVVKAHPAMVEATLHLRGVLPPETIVVVPERHTAFMAAYYGEVNVRLRPPVPLDPEHTFRLLPGAAVRPDLWAALDRMRAQPVPGVVPAISLHPLHPNGLVLLSEPTFQYLVASLPTQEQQWYRAWPIQ